jgi:hypothetical protein
MFCKAKVCYFEYIVPEQDILRFKVSMDDPIFHKLPEAIKDLNQTFHRTLLVNSSNFSQIGPKCATFCKLEDDVEVVLSFMNI